MRLGYLESVSNARRLTFAYFAAVLEEEGSVGSTEEFVAVDPIFVWSLINGRPFVGKLLSLGFLLLAESYSARDETNVTLMRTFVWHFCQHFFTLGVPHVYETIVQFRVMACSNKKETNDKPEYYKYQRCEEIDEWALSPAANDGREGERHIGQLAPSQNQEGNRSLEGKGFCAFTLPSLKISSSPVGARLGCFGQLAETLKGTQIGCPKYLV